MYLIHKVAYLTWKKYTFLYINKKYKFQGESCRYDIYTKAYLEFIRKFLKCIEMGFFWNKIIKNCVNSFPSGLCLGSLEHYVDLIPLTVFIDFY